MPLSNQLKRDILIETIITYFQWKEKQHHNEEKLSQCIENREHTTCELLETIVYFVGSLFFFFANESSQWRTTQQKQITTYNGTTNSTNNELWQKQKKSYPNQKYRLDTQHMYSTHGISTNSIISVSILDVYIAREREREADSKTYDFCFGSKVPYKAVSLQPFAYVYMSVRVWL